MESSRVRFDVLMSCNGNLTPLSTKWDVLLFDWRISLGSGSGRRVPGLQGTQTVIARRSEVRARSARACVRDPGLAILAVR